jgi:hypothetical protein
MTALIAIALIVFLGVALLVFLSGIALYARLIKLRTAVTSARSQVDYAMRKRDDLASGTLSARLEDDVALAVGDYDAAASNYNSAIDTFPADLLAKCFDLNKAEFLDKEFSRQ